MGQYYVIANIDKKEYIDANQFGSGEKLMEFSYQGNSTISYMLQLMANKWKGDRVYVIGDYADNSNMDECWVNTYMKICKDLGISEGEEGILNLYGYIYGNFNQSIIEDLNVEEPRYVYNTRTKTYLDLDHANIAWAYYNDDGSKGATKYSDIALLLAMGNGRGGGDYCCDNSEELVGSWCKYSEDLIVSKEKLTEFENYKEFNPNFYEESLPMPYTLENDLYMALDKMAMNDTSRNYFCIDSIEKYESIKGF